LPAATQARLRLQAAAILNGPAEHPDEALRHLRAVLELALPAQAPERLEAARQVQQLLARRRKWEAVERTLAAAEPLPWDGERAPARVRQLEELLGASPAPPYPGRIHYLLGLNRLAAGDPEGAAAALEEALRRRPALDLHLPVSQRLEQLRSRWALSSVRRWAHTLLGGLLLLVGLAALGGRPWRWLRLAHLLVPVGAAAIWLLLVHGIGAHVGARLPRPPTDMFPEPVYLFAGLGQPGDEALASLALHGLVALVGAWLAAAAVARWRRRVTATLTAAVAGGLIFICAVALFTVRQVESGAEIVAPPTSAASVTLGGLYRPLPDIEPWILTRPLDFPGLRPDSVDEPQMERWIRERVPPAPTAPDPPR